MRELFAFRLCCIECRLQLANRHASVLQDGSDRWPISEDLASGASDSTLDLKRWQPPSTLGRVRWWWG